MKFNEKEMIKVSQKPSQMEGRLQYKAPPGTFRESGFRERYFKLIGNLLFYFRLNEFGNLESKEPVGLIVLENYIVLTSSENELPFAFELLFHDEGTHIFTTRTQEYVKLWTDAFKNASYQHWKNKLIVMQVQLKSIIDKRSQGDNLYSQLQKMNLLDPLSQPHPDDVKRLKETENVAAAANLLAPTPITGFPFSNNTTSTTTTNNSSNENEDLIKF